MAVKKRRLSKIGDYWPRHKRRALIYTISTQLATTLVVGAALVTSGILEPSLVLFTILLATFTAAAGLNILLITYLLAPLADLSAALTHISGEPTIITPPNPNAKHFESDGFKPLLQLIYSLSSGRGADTEKTDEAVNLDSALSTLPVGFIVLDKDRKVIYFNESAPIRTDTNGENVIDLIFENNNSLDSWIESCQDKEVKAEKQWVRIANKIPGEEGRKIYDISASYQKGKEAEVVITLFNRTGIYQPEDDNLDFIAFAAHELRGPITVIRGYLDVLNDEIGSTFDSEQVELMTRLIVSANRLSSYINNILNASRYDRRHLKLHLREGSLADIYETIKDDMQLRASSQNRLLAVDLPDTLPTVAADATGVSEVLGNLIDNAIKYSYEGGVVNVTATAANDFVTVTVEDHGIGMPGQVVSNLFHKFYRSHRSRETVSGTGIGLYICKNIIEAHGGTVGVRSTEGRGSVFTFSLPIYASVAEKLKANNNSNEGFIDQGEGWIKNHAMFRG